MPRLSKPEPFLASVGAQIRSMREQHGLTLEGLAAESDVSKGHLSGIEHGLIWARLDTFMRIAFRLGVPLAELFAVPEGAPTAAERAAAYIRTPRKKRGRPSR